MLKLEVVIVVFLVVEVDVEDIFDSEGGAEEVSTGVMDDTLSLSGQARSLKSKVKAHQ